SHEAYSPPLPVDDNSPDHDSIENTMQTECTSTPRDSASIISDHTPTTSPTVTTKPVSSRNSRRTVSIGSSPCSTPPPGRNQRPGTSVSPPALMRTARSPSTSKP